MEENTFQCIEGMEKLQNYRNVLIEMEQSPKITRGNLTPFVKPYIVFSFHKRDGNPYRTRQT